VTVRLIRVLPAACAVALAAVLAADVTAQGPPGGGPPLAVQGQQGLAFGSLLGGIATPVPVSDPANAAQFRVRQGNRTVEVSFLLPTAMTRAGGGEVPLVFSTVDAAYSTTQNAAGGTPFDPNLPWLLPPGGGGGWNWIFLGGTAHPPHGAPPGSYQATLVLTITDLGS
jgi:hypothetical protein